MVQQLLSVYIFSYVAGDKERWKITVNDVRLDRSDVMNHYLNNYRDNLLLG